MSALPNEALAALFRQRLTPDAGRWATPGDLAKFLNPATVQTPALDLIDQELVRLVHTPSGRLIISMPPQEGKSSRVAQVFPVWELAHDPEKRIVLTSYGVGLARRNSRQVRSSIVTFGDHLGIHVRHDVSSQTEWQLAGHQGSVYATGVGGELTGRPADLMIIDDPFKGMAEASSELIRNSVWQWWLSTVMPRLAPSAPVVLIMTRWHEDDLAGRMIQDDPRWRVVNVPAQADHNPEAGESDPLGREPGEFLESARGRTREQWEQIKRNAGSRVWSALYQGRPAPAEGGLLKRSLWQWFDQPLWDEQDGVRRVAGGELLASWDMAFKGTTNSDFVAGQVWLHRGSDMFLLDMVHRRMSFLETLHAVEAQLARWPQLGAKLVEDKANGTAILDVLRQRVPGLVPVTPHESKEARASAITPFLEAGNVHLPSFLPWAQDLVEEAAAFPNGAHDDMVDATTQALSHVFLAGSSARMWLDFLGKELSERSR
jgi:predicted phage terminase large subunit-like protein